MRCINSSSHSCTPLSLLCLSQIPFFFLVHSHFSSPTFHINFFLSFLSLWCMHNPLSLWPVVISSSTSCLTVTICCISISFSPFSSSWTTSSGFIVHILKDLTWRSIWYVNRIIIRVKNVILLIRNGNMMQLWERKKKSYYICSYII